MISVSDARARVASFAPQTAEGRQRLLELGSAELEQLQTALRPSDLALQAVRLGWRLLLLGTLVGMAGWFFGAGPGWGLGVGGLLGLLLSVGCMAVSFGKVAPYLGLLPLNARQERDMLALVATSVPAVSAYRDAVPAGRPLIAADMLAMKALRATPAQG